MLRVLGVLPFLFAVATSAPAAAAEWVRFTIGGSNGPAATWRLPKNPAPTSGVGVVGDEYKAFWVDADALIYGRWSRISINSVVFFEDLTTLGIWQDGKRISIAYVFRDPDFNGGFWEGPGSNPTFKTGLYWFGQNSGGESIGGSMTITDTAIPEPATWALLIAGFGLVGATLRRRPAHA